MKLRTAKKQVPKDFRKLMYENYKASMRFYEKPITPYKEWIKLVLTTKFQKPKNNEKSNALNRANEALESTGCGC